MTSNQARFLCDDTLFAKLEKLLSTWFATGLSRDSVPTLTTEDSDLDLALFAASIFKRGLAGVKTPNGVTLQTPSQNAPFPLFPKICCLMADEFFLTITVPSVDVCYVVDSGFARHWPQVTRAAGPIFYIEATEKNKTLRTVADLLRQLPPSTKKLVAIGGGLTLDLAGFAAGIMGIPFESVPTTLLASVDAGLGGKTGVNHPEAGKNQIGLFHSTISMSLVPQFFSTQSTAELCSGLCEGLKHCWLTGSDLDALNLIDHLRNQENSAAVSRFLLDQLVTKFQFVLNDPFERLGIRQHLNFGHTFGHIFESLGLEGFIEELPHGLCVGLGMKLLLEAKFVKHEPGFYSHLLAVLGKAAIEMPLKAKGDLVNMRNRILTLLQTDKKQTHRTKTIQLALAPFGAFSSHEKPFGHKSFDYVASFEDESLCALILAQLLCE